MRAAAGERAGIARGRCSDAWMMTFLRRNFNSATAAGGDVSNIMTCSRLAVCPCVRTRVCLCRFVSSSTEDNAVLRHHSISVLESLLSLFVYKRDIVRTAAAFQTL